MAGLAEIPTILCGSFFAVVIILTFLSGVDELFIDLVYLCRIALFRQGRKVYTESELSISPEQPVAIMIPTWDEANVIATMLGANVAALRYSNYHVFVGTYPNDGSTRAAVGEVCRKFPQVHEVVGSTDGPTTKSQCLNVVYKAILEWERRHNVRFEIFVQHDSEDSIHGLSLKVFNIAVPEWDMVQLPVFSRPCPFPSLVASHYLDEFAEHHQKGLVVRQFLTGSVPGAGVGCGFSRPALEAMASLSSDGNVFRPDALTEDYDFAFRLMQAGYRTTFWPVHIRRMETHLGEDLRLTQRICDDLVCTQENFPHEFEKAVKQKSRWILGIALQGFRQIGWKGNAWMRYMLVRDRKTIITSPLSVLSWLTVLGYLWPLPGLPSWLWMLAIVNFYLAAWRGLVRMYWVHLRYGPVAAMWSIWGFLVGMIVALAATYRAIKKWSAHVRFGTPLRWDKTDHTFVVEETELRDPKLGDLLLEGGLIQIGQLELALALQLKDQRPLGQILVEMGFIDRRDLEDVLARQKSKMGSIC